jgi:hypothetical protein
MLKMTAKVLNISLKRKLVCERKVTKLVEKNKTLNFLNDVYFYSRRGAELCFRRGHKVSDEFWKEKK